jgi:hypothetical protein
MACNYSLNDKVMKQRCFRVFQNTDFEKSYVYIFPSSHTFFELLVSITFCINKLYFIIYL